MIMLPCETAGFFHVAVRSSGRCSSLLIAWSGVPSLMVFIYRHRLFVRVFGAGGGDVRGQRDRAQRR